MSKIGDRQNAILGLFKDSKEVTKRHIVDQFGHWYYCNAAFHIGEVLTRMVRSRMIVRVRHGVYAKPASDGPQVDQISVGSKLSTLEVMPAMAEWAKARGLI